MASSQLAVAPPSSSLGHSSSATHDYEWKDASQKEVTVQLSCWQERCTSCLLAPNLVRHCKQNHHIDIDKEEFNQVLNTHLQTRTRQLQTKTRTDEFRRIWSKALGRHIWEKLVPIGRNVAHAGHLTLAQTDLATLVLNCPFCKSAHTFLALLQTGKYGHSSRCLTRAVEGGYAAVAQLYYQSTRESRKLFLRACYDIQYKPGRSLNQAIYSTVPQPLVLVKELPVWLLERDDQRSGEGSGSQPSTPVRSDSDDGKGKGKATSSPFSKSPPYSRPGSMPRASSQASMQRAASVGSQASLLRGRPSTSRSPVPSGPATTVDGRERGTSRSEASVSPPGRSTSTGSRGRSRDSKPATAAVAEGRGSASAAGQASPSRGVQAATSRGGSIAPSPLRSNLRAGTVGITSDSNVVLPRPMHFGQSSRSTSRASQIRARTRSAQSSSSRSSSTGFIASLLAQEAEEREARLALHQKRRRSSSSLRPAVL